MPNYENLSEKIAEKVALHKENPYAFSDENAIRRNGNHDKPTADVRCKMSNRIIKKGGEFSLPFLLASTVILQFFVA